MGKREYHELTRKIWPGLGVCVESEDKIIRAYLSEKARDIKKRWDTGELDDYLKDILGLSNSSPEQEWVEDIYAKKRANSSEEPVRSDAPMGTQTSGAFCHEHDWEFSGRSNEDNFYKCLCGVTKIVTNEPKPSSEKCPHVYESDCHGVEMIKGPDGNEYAVGGTANKSRWKFDPWCGLPTPPVKKELWEKFLGFTGDLPMGARITLGTKMAQDLADIATRHFSEKGE